MLAGLLLIAAAGARDPCDRPRPAERRACEPDALAPAQGDGTAVLVVHDGPGSTSAASPPSTRSPRALRARILEGDLEPGERLRERELTEAYGVARHSRARGAALARRRGPGADRAEPRRERRAARRAPRRSASTSCAPRWSWRPRGWRSTRHGGRLPDDVREAVAELRSVCERPQPAWGDVAAAHNEVHLALVRAARSERIERAYAALAGELLLLLRQLKPHWTLARMADDHERLVEQLERRGPAALREHLRDSMRAVTGVDPD